MEKFFAPVDETLNEKIKSVRRRAKRLHRKISNVEIVSTGVDAINKKLSKEEKI